MPVVEDLHVGPARGAVPHAQLDLVRTALRLGHICSAGGPTPVTAVGPGSRDLAGYYPNTHVHDVILKQLRRR